MSVVDYPTPDQQPDGPAPASRSSGGPLVAALRGARRQWPLAALVGLVLGTAGGVAYFSTNPPKWTVTATLYIAPEQNILNERKNGGSDQLGEYQKGQAALLRTRQVLRQALQDEKVAGTALIRSQEDPVGWLETSLKTMISDGGLLHVSLTGESATEAATVLNAVTEAYLKLIVDAEKDDRFAKVADVDNILVKMEDRLRGKREELGKLANQLQTSDTETLTLKQKQAIESLNKHLDESARLESELRKVRAEVTVLRARVEAVRAGLLSDTSLAAVAGASAVALPRARSGPLPDTLLAEMLAADPVVRISAAKVQEAQEKLEIVKKGAQPTAPALIPLEKDLRQAEEELALVQVQRREAVELRTREVVLQKTLEDLREVETRKQVLETQKAELAPQLSKLAAEAERIGLKSFELEMRRAELAEAEEIVRRLRGERERLAVELDTYKRRVKDFPADPSEARPSNYRLPATAGLGVAGFALGVFVVGFIESRRRRLVVADDLPRTLQLRTVGTVPEAPGLAAFPVKDLWGGGHGVLASVVIEATNDIRAMLLCGGLAGHPKVVLVTSSVQGEGKTTLACLLAISIAQTAKRTLLIDGDIRNPRVHEQFGLPIGPGLSEVLRGEAALADVIHEIPDSNLSVLPAGRVCSRVVRGLTSDAIRALLAPLRERYDLILLDSCPILPVPDGLILSKCVDATVLVVRSGTSTEPVVREACERLASVRATVVGGVLNRLTVGRSQIRYPYANLAVAEPGPDSLLEEPGRDNESHPAG